MNKSREGFLLAAIVGLLAPIASVAGSSPAANAVGPWPFCNGSTTRNCIESVVIDSHGSGVNTYTDATALSNAGGIIDVGCLTGSCETSLSTDDVIAANKNNCAAISSLPFPVFITSKVAGHRDHSTTINLNMGTFEPALSIGSGIETTAISKNQDGTWKYSLTVHSVVTMSTSGPLPAEINSLPEPARTSAIEERLKTSVADSASAGSSVSVFPPTILRWVGSTRDNPWLKSTCELIPASGAWATANATNFQFGLYTKSAASEVPWLFKFKASGPHFIKSDMLDVQPTVGFGVPNQGPFTGTQMVNPADFRMWVPATYGTALGYASASEMRAGITVTASDGQSVSPTVVSSGNGYEINFGIAHYSAPNPTVSFKPGRLFPVAAQSSTSGPKMKVGKSTTQSSLLKAAGLTAPKSSKVTITVKSSSARYCRKSGTSVKALKAGTCSVTVTVKPKSGAAKTRTVKVAVTK